MNLSLQEILLYSPLVLSGVYILYVLIKPNNESDEFFELSRKLTLENLMHRIDQLEKINNADYSKEKVRIKSFYKDHRLSQKEFDQLEDIITNTYFDGFQRKWTSFRKSDILLKAIFVFSIIGGFLLFGFIIYEINIEKELELRIWHCILATLILFPIPMVFIVMYLGLFSVLLSLLRFVFPQKGSLFRAAILSEELIKGLKPGGRSTEIDLSSVDWGNIDSF